MICLQTNKMFLQRINTFLSPECLKAAIMQSHNCLKYLRICAHFGLMNANQEKTGTNFMFLSQVDKVFLFFKKTWTF